MRWRTASRSSHRLRFGAVLVALATVASACASNAPQDPNRVAGPVARQLDRLADPVFLVAGFVMVLVLSLVLFVVIRFRRQSEDEAPKQIHGHVPMEIAWTVIPALILAVIGVFTVATVLDINKIDRGPETLQVTVIGHQWWWEYEYPSLGITTANEMHIPAGQRVQLTLKSVDVIHSFWPPRLAGKVDVIPGRINTMQIEADEPGTFFGQCAEFCGIAHSRMKLRVVADSEAGFEEWVRGQKAKPTTPTTGESAEGSELFQSRGCSGCHTVEGVSEGDVGPNLTHLFSRRSFAGSLFELDDQHLRKWLRDPQKEKPGNLMKLPVPLTEDEITKLIAYLRTLK